MNADTFCEAFKSSGGKPRPIAEVIDQWALEKKSRIAEDYRGLEIFVAELLADANIGDGLLDQISPELLAAFAARRGSNFDTYDEIRTYLADELANGHRSVEGVTNMIKGQIGELEFVRHSGGHAYLAPSTNQEAWDVAVKHLTGSTEFVQVKIYQSADKALRAMQEVQQKVSAGIITDGHGHVVHHINFAVNEDIANVLREKAALHPELAGIRIYDIGMTDTQATEMVIDGFNNVGPDELAHIFGQWFGGTLSAACLHAMANAFLVYKGSKTATAGFEGAIVSTAISAPGVAVAQGTAWWASGSKIAALSGHPILAAIASGMIARTIVKKWYESREGTVALLAHESIHTSELVVSLARI
jgi:hypothetical protein